MIIQVHLGASPQYAFIIPIKFRYTAESGISWLTVQWAVFYCIVECVIVSYISGCNPNLQTMACKSLFVFLLLWSACQCRIGGHVHQQHQ